MITPEYKDQLVKMHQSQFWGGKGYKALPKIFELMIGYQLDAPTILDYGAGERTFERDAKRYLPRAVVTSYDPGILGIDKPPPHDQFDIVVCTDVLEHVEPQYVEQTLARLRALTGHVAHLSISCTAARAILPDGRNAHLSVHPSDWWLEKINALWREVKVISEGKQLIVQAHR